MAKTYVVFVGHRPGIYNSWPEAQRQVYGFRGAIHESFPTRAQAEQAFLDYWGMNDYPIQTIESSRHQERHLNDQNVDVIQYQPFTVYWSYLIIAFCLGVILTLICVGSGK